MDYRTTDRIAGQSPAYSNDLIPPPAADWEPPRPGDICTRCGEWPAGYSLPGQPEKFCWPCLCAVHADHQEVGHAAR